MLDVFSNAVHTLVGDGDLSVRVRSAYIQCHPAKPSGGVVGALVRELHEKVAATPPGRDRFEKMTPAQLTEIGHLIVRVFEAMVRESAARPH